MAELEQGWFGPHISREDAIKMLENGFRDGPVSLMCQEYGEDDDAIGIDASDLDTIKNDPSYKTFWLWFSQDAYSYKVKCSCGWEGHLTDDNPFCPACLESAL